MPSHTWEIFANLLEHDSQHEWKQIFLRHSKAPFLDFGKAEQNLDVLYIRGKDTICDLLSSTPTQKKLN